MMLVSTIIIYTFITWHDYAFIQVDFTDDDRKDVDQFSRLADPKCGKVDPKVASVFIVLIESMTKRVPKRRPPASEVRMCIPRMYVCACVLYYITGPSKVVFSHVMISATPSFGETNIFYYVSHTQLIKYKYTSIQLCTDMSLQRSSPNCSDTFCAHNL